MKCYLFVSFLLLNNLRRFFSSKNAPPYLKVCFYFMISLFTTVELSWRGRPHNHDSENQTANPTMNYLAMPRAPEPTGHVRPCSGKAFDDSGLHLAEVLYGLTGLIL